MDDDARPEGVLRMKGTTRLGMTVAALLVAASAGAQTAPIAPLGAGALPESALWQTLSVTGVGHVTLTPDRASFTAGVESLAPAVSTATQDNATRMTAVLAALRKAGAGYRDLRTSGLSIYPQQTQQPGQPPRIVGYQVSNVVTVTRDDPASMAKLLEAAVNAGANTVSGLSFTVSDSARGREDGLQAAFADARAKAEVLARAAGRTAGRALAIVEGEGGSRPPIPMPRAYVAKAMVASAPVESGAEEMTFTVSVVFELQ
jgi:uncharacterized protein